MSEERLIPIGRSLSLDLARAVADGTLAAGRKAGLLPLTVVVLDAGGRVVVMKREDGCGVIRMDVALGKANAALGMGVAGRTIRDRLAQRVGFQTALAAAADGRFAPVPGGVLILDANRRAIGAVGLSGDASDKDESAAIEGIKATGGMAEPAEGWQVAGL